LEELPKQLAKKKGGPCVGVKELLDWSHAHPEVHNALLTGNVKRGAFLKLKYYGLDKFFEFGAFGDDSPDRNKLGPIALERARTLLKKDFHINYTWVIGDTPRDIDCARALGCKVLAVATGRYSVAHLEQYQPNMAFENLLDYASIIEGLENH
jgi:phosphoglycolate phosphatase